jgi:hypothetical protein
VQKQCVRKIDELRELNTDETLCVELLGYHAPGDGGGGTFYWDTSAASEDDNAGTVIKPVQPSQLGGWRRVFDGSVSVKWFGAVGNGITDDTDAIQAAEDVVAVVGGIVLFPPGTYIINGAKAPIPGEDPRKYGINKKSNTKWVGYGYASSILKLKDKSTSDKVDPEKVFDPQMIYANTKLNDIGFYSLGFDLNGANNPLPRLANVAAIWLNGESLEAHGMVVEGCRFYNGPGATVILVQNVAKSWCCYPLDDVLILNNRFEDNCLSPATDDHSTLNIWARRTRVIGNIFQETSVVPNMQRYFHASAVEFHGADSLFLGNIIRSYGSVVTASENFIEPWENLLIANNLASDLGRNFVMTNVATEQKSKPIDKIVVRGNHVVFNDDIGSGTKAGLMQGHGKPISYIEVSENYFEMSSPSADNSPIGVLSHQQGPRTSYTTHLKISGNTFNKMKFGVWVDNYAFHDQVKNLEYANNTCLNMQDLSIDKEAAGLWAGGTDLQHLENVIVTGNRFINEDNNLNYKYGIILGREIDNLYLGSDNVFYNIKTMPVWERFPVIFNWRGPVIEMSFNNWPPGSGNIDANSFVSFDMAVRGAALGDLATCSFSLDVQDLVMSAAVTAADTVTITLRNNKATTVVLDHGTLFIKVTKIIMPQQST